MHQVLPLDLWPFINQKDFFFFPLLKQVFFFFLALRDIFAAAWAATLQSLLIQRKRHHENLDLKFKVLHIILATD